MKKQLIAIATVLFLGAGTLAAQTATEKTDVQTQTQQKEEAKKEIKKEQLPQEVQNTLKEDRYADWEVAKVYEISKQAYMNKQGNMDKQGTQSQTRGNVDNQDMTKKDNTKAADRPNSNENYKPNTGSASGAGTRGGATAATSDKVYEIHLKKGESKVTLTFDEAGNTVS